MKLRVGEALLFSPSAIVGLEKGSEGVTVMERLGTDYLKIRVRKRLTANGGKSDILTDRNVASHTFKVVE